MAEFTVVDPSSWRDQIRAAVAAGHDMLMQLTAVDEIGRSDEVRILAWLDNITTHQRIHLAVLLDRAGPRLDSIADLIPGATWLERQVHDFFGVEFIGGDSRPLLNHQGGAPLLKDVLLEPRLDTAWPGALEPGESDASPSRRRIVPPGVPDETVRADAAATAADVAMSAAGMRVRRGR